MADNIFFDRQYLTSWADALREATETTNPLEFPEDFNDLVRSLTVQMPTLSNPASEAQVLEGYEIAGQNGEVKVGTIPIVIQATPNVNVSSNGLITVSAKQDAGYVTEGTKSATQQLTTKGATTITPSTSAQTAVEAGVFTTGAIKVAAVPVYNGE